MLLCMLVSGFGNRVWVNPSQQKGGYIQPVSFSSPGNDDWGRGGGRRENVKSTEFTFSSQNRFSSLNAANIFDRRGGGGGGGGTAAAAAAVGGTAGEEDDDKKL